MTNKVVTITLNPALDLTGSLDVLNVGSVSIITSDNRDQGFDVELIVFTRIGG